jgi:hypothetical protein
MCGLHPRMLDFFRLMEFGGRALGNKAEHAASPRFQNRVIGRQPWLDSQMCEPAADIDQRRRNSACGQPAADKGQQKGAICSLDQMLVYETNHGSVLDWQRRVTPDSFLAALYADRATEASGGRHCRSAGWSCR